MAKAKATKKAKRAAPPAKKRNPQDTTLRNNRATGRAIGNLRAELETLALNVEEYRQEVRKLLTLDAKLQLRVEALERPMTTQ